MEVKANDIQFSSQVEIVDGEKPIATIQELIMNMPLFLESEKTF